MASGNKCLKCVLIGRITNVNAYFIVFGGANINIIAGINRIMIISNVCILMLSMQWVVLFFLYNGNALQKVYKN